MVKEMIEPSYVVGIGASAGGLDPLQELFENIPENTGMAFVVVQHLSPNFKSLMDELLKKHTRLPVSIAKDNDILKADHIYLNPRDKNIVCRDGKLKLIEKNPDDVLNLPIDIFFHSLGTEYEHKALGIILSGTGTDGSRGIGTIKEAGGTIIVQDPATAQFDGMPRAAVNSYLAEYVLSPKQIAEELARFPIKPSFSPIIDDNKTEADFENIFNAILDELLQHSSIDFKNYKQETLLRRIEKRMGIHNINHLEDYYLKLKNNKEEQDVLFKDCLIGVTNFFRDREAYNVIKEKILPEIFSKTQPYKTLRIWVVGCSTGEEAYSLAILLDEYSRLTKQVIDFKIFATDIDRKAIEYASHGIFPINHMADISKERLENYFVKSGDKFQIVQHIRDKIVFSPHNILSDPPFIKMDFISCRNVLIYMKNEVQKKILLNLLFSLNKGGFLFLGSSESPGELKKYFDTVDGKYKLFRNMSTEKIYPHQFQIENSYIKTRPKGNELHAFNRNVHTKQQPENYFTKLLSEEYAPTSIFIDKDYNILHFNGKLKKYLTFAPGAPNNNVLKMLEGNLSSFIKNGVRRVNEENKKVVFDDIKFVSDGEKYSVKIVFKKFPSSDNREYIYLIEFSENIYEKEEAVVYNQYELDEFSKQRIEDLESELNKSKVELQSVIEELETSNEELQASNEELQASNEELQSTNEELQSVNEELYTVNSELQEKNSELTALNNDVNNLLNSTNVGILFLDNDLKIRKFTPELVKLFDLQDDDIGRPIRSFASKFDENTREGIIRDARKVFQQPETIQRINFDLDNNSYLIKILPFITHEKRTEGVLLNFIDVTGVVKAEKEQQESLYKYETLIYTLGEIVYERFPEDNKIYLSGNVQETLGYFPKNINGNDKDWMKIIHPADLDKFNRQLKQAKAEDLVYDIEYRVKHKDGNYIWFNDKGKMQLTEEGGIKRINGVLKNIHEKKLFDYELQKQKKFFEDVYNSVDVGLFIMSVHDDKRVIFEAFNRKQEGITGIQFETVSDKTIAELVPDVLPQEIANQFDNKIKECIQQSSVLTFEQQYPQNGADVWLLVQLVPLFDSEGNVIRIVGSAVNITRRKQLELELRRNELNMQYAQNVASLGSWEWDLVTNEVYWSDQFYKLLGLEPGSSQPSYEEIYKYIHPDDRGKARNALDDAVDNKKEYTLNIRVAHLDNTIRWVLSKGKPLQDQHGNVVKFIGIFLDITEQKHNQDEINKLYQSFIQSPTPEILTDANGIIEYVNPGFTELTGYTWDEVIDKKTNILKSGQHSQEFYQNMWKKILNHEVWTGELLNKKKNGESYWEHASISPIVDEEGNIVNFLKTAQDITDIINQREEFAVAKEKAEHADRLKSTFLANLSHEIRTPMSAIIGIGQLLKDSEMDEETRSEFLSMINTQGEYLLTLINDIIDISKIEAGVIKLREETCDISTLLDDLVTFFKQNNPGEIELKTTRDSGLKKTEINIDATRLQQILTNLIGNAIKFTDEGYVKFGYELEKGKNMLKFYVKDTGIGISPSKLDTIFDRFFQLESQGKKYVTKGTGLGLAISKALVELMGGKIWVESEMYVGSTFYFTIPYKPVEKKKQVVKISPDRYQNIFEGKTVMIAEDIESNYVFMQYALKDTGARFIWVKNGKEAIEEVKKGHHVDLILMDVNMPVLDGLQATRKIKQINPELPVIAVTAYAMEGDRKKSIDAGCDDYISKPVKTNQLIDLINKYMVHSAKPSIG